MRHELVEFLAFYKSCKHDTTLFAFFLELFGVIVGVIGITCKHEFIAFLGDEFHFIDEAVKPLFGNKSAYSDHIFTGFKSQ
ncbi:Uncharacterised protein [Chlamydia trachomatis]|nr:Uncharacterised protein [Chlamydia trachomatis]